MKEEKLYSIIKSEIITEKSVGLKEKNNQIVLKVARFATKIDVKQAIEELFKVSVLSVRVLNVAGKTKRYKGTIGKHADWRKAIVKLKAEDSFDVLNFA